MSIAAARNIGAFLKTLIAINHDQILAGGAKDNVAQNGRGVDRKNYLSAVAQVHVSCALAASQTATVTAKIQDSPDNVTYTDFLVPTDSLVISDGADENGVYKVDVDLSGADKYVRIVYTVNLSAGATDTADVAGIFTLAGEHERPFA